MVGLGVGGCRGREGCLVPRLLAQSEVELMPDSKIRFVGDAVDEVREALVSVNDRDVLALHCVDSGLLCLLQELIVLLGAEATVGLEAGRASPAANELDGRVIDTGSIEVSGEAAAVAVPSVNSCNSRSEKEGEDIS